MKVPAPVKAVFDTFPLVTHPAAAVDDNEGVHKYRLTRAAGTPADAPAGDFTLAVHNVVAVGGVIVPTDPVSLGQCLVLSLRHGLRLPRAGDDGSAAPAGSAATASSAATAGSIVALAYQAAPDNELPMLIEDLPTRTLHSRAAMRASSAKLLCATDTVLDDMVETRLYDAWQTCLLVDAGDDALRAIFSLGLPDGAPVLARVCRAALLHDVPAWRSLGARHAAAAWPQLYARQVAAAAELLALLAARLTLHPCAVLEAKVAAFCVAVDATLRHTALGAAVRASGCVPAAYGVLARF